MEKSRSYEFQYKELVNKILNKGELKETRNGKTLSLFGESIIFNLSNNDFPLLTSRQIFYKGVFGELAALLRQPKNIKDFEAQGCNYWKLWAKENGDINIDYGNAWLNWNGINQLEKLIYTLKNNPNDRRMIITGWNPSNLDNLDLPCCHYAYQWYVRDNKYLDMLWHQRSADTMIGLPSDAVFAAAWNIAIANEAGLIPGEVKMIFGDVHIYLEHAENALQYLTIDTVSSPKYILHSNKYKQTIKFEPNDITIDSYKPQSKIKFELKS